MRVSYQGAATQWLISLFISRDLLTDGKLELEILEP